MRSQLNIQHFYGKKKLRSLKQLFMRNCCGVYLFSRKKISRKPIKTIIGRTNNLFVIDEAFNLYSLKI